LSLYVGRIWWEEKKGRRIGKKEPANPAYNFKILNLLESQMEAGGRKKKGGGGRRKGNRL